MIVQIESKVFPVISNDETVRGELFITPTYPNSDITHPYELRIGEQMFYLSRKTAKHIALRVIAEEMK